jgi:hypothetical protein
MQRLIPLVLLWSAVDSTGADRFQFQSGTNHTALIELYTSEGCSSCPPAEESFSRLKAHARLWVDFVPAAFHVDYWDYLGWRDPFGAPDYSERQQAYAAEWKSRSVYTPGFVLDGYEWRGRFSADKLPSPSPRTVGTLTLNSEDSKRWTLRFEPTSRSSSGSVVFYAALLGFDLSTNVKAGENRGRKLQHDFVVLTMSKVEPSQSGEAFEGMATLPPPRIHCERFAVAAWVCRSGTLEPLQAVGGWLPSAKR